MLNARKTVIKDDSIPNCGTNAGKRSSPVTVAATQSQQSGVRGPCRHGYSLTYMLLPRRLPNEAPPRDESVI